MIKAALEYILSLNRLELVEAGGSLWTDRKPTRVSHSPKAEPISTYTLAGLTDYIRAEVDEMAEKMVVQVESPLEVRLFSKLDGERARETLVIARGRVPDFPFGRYMDNEEFLIALQSKFLPSADRDLLLKFAGTTETGTVASYGDDGVTQKATVRKGIAGKADCAVPNPVHLFPYRTFVEVEQPGSAFIFRMRDNSAGIQCAIFEADGGAWRNMAMDSIKEYLQDELKEYGRFTVI